MYHVELTRQSMYFLKGIRKDDFFAYINTVKDKILELCITYRGVLTIVKLDRDGVEKVKNILQRYEIDVWDPETEPEDVKMAGGGLLFP